LISTIAGDIAQWAAVILLSGGLAATWWKNGKGEAKRQGVIEEKIGHLEVSISKSSSKSDTILESLHGMKEHCAGVTAGFTARIDTLEKRRKR